MREWPKSYDTQHVILHLSGNIAPNCITVCTPFTIFYNYLKNRGSSKCLVCSTEERKSSLEQHKKVNDDRIVVLG